MGFEHFRVQLRGGKASYHEVEAAVRQLPNTRPDHEATLVPGSAYYCIADGQHVIELELTDSPVRLSCRFTLCHPPSVDTVFLGLVRDLVDRFGMEARVCDDVRPEHDRAFSLAEFPEFAEVVSCAIPDRRAEWIGAFGGELIGASTREVYQRVILPPCQSDETALLSEAALAEGWSQPEEDAAWAHLQSDN